MSTVSIVENAAAQIEIPASGMSKQVLLQEQHLRIMGFGFAAGHELKEHTAPVNVLLHFLEGDAEVTLAGEQTKARAGSMIHIPQGMPHSVRAVTAVKMLLLMLQP